MEEITYRVGVFESIFVNFCPPSLRPRPLSCTGHYSLEYANMYAKCLGVKRYTPYYINSSTTNDVLNLNVDLVPFATVLNERDFGELYFSTPLYADAYGFFTKRTDNAALINPYFLLSPFAVDTWITTVVLLSFCSLLVQCIDYLEIRDLLKRKSIASISIDFVTFTLLVGAVMTLYDANLTAYVNVFKHGSAPFDSLEELTGLIRNKKRTLINDNLKANYIWLVIRGAQGYRIGDVYPPDLASLYEATSDNPALEIPRLDCLCRKLAENGSLVFVGRQSDLDDQCSQYCFWRTDFNRVPLQFRTFAFPIDSPLKEIGNLCVDFVRTYRETKIGRQKKRPLLDCYNKIGEIGNSDTIQFPDFLLAVFVWMFGASTGCAAFVIEILYKRQRTSPVFV